MIYHGRSTMQVICKGRGRGKTTDLVKLAIEKDAWLVVPSKMDLLSVQDMFPDFQRMITWKAFNNHGLKSVHPDQRRIVIDDLDRCIMGMLGAHILAVSVNDDNDERSAEP